jgi:cobyrinic acid a,c-diamide synthase
VIAGLAGDSGKTLVSLGLLFLAAGRGLAVQGFKKGPDYIDAAWLRWAAGRPARNLDTYLMGFEKPVHSFLRHAQPGGLNVIEGNRGLFDGVDAHGSHSTAELAKALRAPVLLVLNATKVTRTAAAFVLGCQYLDTKLRLAGVILNRVGTVRQERLLREAIESASGVPVVGILPRATDEALLPSRHLGLVIPEEHPDIERVRAGVLELVKDHLDFPAIEAIAREAPPLPPPATAPAELPNGRGLRIAYLSDAAFTFYYPENLEALAAAGAELAPVRALEGTGLPPHIHALYIGGGFPETHGARLAASGRFLESLRRAAADGLPIYAECGGLMVLARAVHWHSQRFPMAGVLPFEVEVCDRPQGHGYADLLVDRGNPFYPPGVMLRGHEFHYSRVIPAETLPDTACAVTRGTGVYDFRDGVVVGQTFAAYTHVHALATPEWTAALLGAARRRQRSSA